MMRKFELIIKNSCKHCPNCLYVEFDFSYCCNETGKDIMKKFYLMKDKSTGFSKTVENEWTPIPDWCPLPIMEDDDVEKT